MGFEQTFKNIDNALRNEAGCATELDYVEQGSWLLFLKYLDDLEEEKKQKSALAGAQFTPIIAEEYQWRTWAVPKNPDGQPDDHRMITGDDLIDFVNHKLFPYLQSFKQQAQSPDTIHYKIGEIFSEIENKIKSGHNLRDLIDRIDELHFSSKAEKDDISHLYEDKIKNMGNAGRNGGEYYTPRPLIKTIVKIVNPQIGETIYDGAVGSAGFLCSAFEYMKAGKTLSAQDSEILQQRTFYGQEKKSLAYIIGIMNMIFHGIEAPNIIHDNSLNQNIADIQPQDRHDVILANPPFGGKERPEIQQNFNIKTGETAFLFLQYFIKKLKTKGRAGIVIKNTFLSNDDNAATNLRRELLETCNLHTILDMPGGTFQGAGVKTVVLFFTKGTPTENIWYYQLKLDRNLGKTNPLNENDMAEFLELQAGYEESVNSWNLNIADIDPDTFDLSVKNPNEIAEAPLRSPQEIIQEISALDTQSAEILQAIKVML